MNFFIIPIAFWLAGLMYSQAAPETPAAPPNQVSVELAAPPMEGTVSIGVFNTAGQCVRVLYAGVDQEKIPSALNGYLVTWDGKTDSGSSAPAGEYEIRGITVGDVNIEIGPFLFNDWQTDSAKKTPARIQSVRLLEGGDLLLLDSRSQLFRVSAKGEILWTETLPGHAVGLTIFNQMAAAFSPADLVTADLEKGTITEPSPPVVGLTTLTATGSSLLGVIGQQLVHFETLAWEPVAVSNVPPGVCSIAAAGQMILVSDGTSVFQQMEGGFEKIDLPLSANITHLATGAESTFWASTSDASLTQFDLNGNALRSLEPGDEDAFLTFDVSHDNKRIALVSSKGGRQRLRVLELTASQAADVSLWKTTLQKDIQDGREFGIDPATSLPVAQGALPTNQTFTVALVENPLNPKSKESLEVGAANRKDGVWLVAANRFPLVRVLRDDNSKRIALVREIQTDFFHLYAEIDGAVADFSISGLSKMMQFTSDKIQWPPGPRQAADESNIPSNQPAPTPE